MRLPDYQLELCSPLSPTCGKPEMGENGNGQQCLQDATQPDSQSPAHTSATQAGGLGWRFSTPRIGPDARECVLDIGEALAATHLTAHRLFGVTPYDPMTLTAVSLALLTVGALAGYISHASCHARRSYGCASI